MKYLVGFTVFFLLFATLLGLSSRSPSIDEVTMDTVSNVEKNKASVKVPKKENNQSKEKPVENLSGIDQVTGLIIDDKGHWETVRNNCIACHSAKIVTQNKMSRTTWLETIRWMQESQGLWPLGDSENLILDYLSTYYGVEQHSAKIRKPIYL